MAIGVSALFSGCLLMSMMDVLSSSPHPRPIVNGTPAKNSEKTRRREKTSSNKKTFSVKFEIIFFCVPLDQFPFAVAFGLKEENSDSLLVFCGGTHITQTPKYSWAISAAHCFLDL